MGKIVVFSLFKSSLLALHDSHSQSLLNKSMKQKAEIVPQQNICSTKNAINSVSWLIKCIN